MIESSTQMAWRRFSRGLPPEAQSVSDAIGLGMRSLSQWQTCLESAKHHASRINRNIHRRGAGRPHLNSVAWRSLKLLSNGAALTAEEITHQIGRPHVDVVRRGLSRFGKRGLVVANPGKTKREPRRFSITRQGRSVLKQLEGEP